jgi:hypothetical protein
MSNIGADAAKLAGLQIDALTKFRSGQLSLDHLERFLNLSPEAREDRFGTNWRAVVTQPKPTPSILELVSIVVVSATTSKFVAKEKFVINTKRNAPVKISYLGDNFTDWFLSGSGKTEDPESEQTLRYHKLRKASVDGPIITELGGEAKAETTLSEMFSLMEKQKNGESGTLLNNGWANIFYIRDSAGVLRAVYVHWDGGGWRVRAYALGDPFRWLVGRQTFSRNSVLGSSETSAPAA